MKRIILVYSLLLFSFLANAQVKHEVKLSIMRALYMEYLTSYEMVVSKHIGVEVDLGLHSYESILYEPGIHGKEFGFLSLNFRSSLGGKFYFNPKDFFGSGFFFGPYVAMNQLIYRDSKYVDKWEEINKSPAPPHIRRDKGIKSLFYGLHGGAKLVAKYNIIFEPKITYFVRDERGFDKLLWSLEYFLKVGYRF